MENKYKIKIQLLALLLIATMSVFATDDTIPNHGFENWTCPSYCDPNSWSDPNTFTNSYGYTEVSKATAGAHVHSGLYAAKLTTQDVIIQNAPGVITTGVIDASTQNIYGGCPINFRPAKFKGWFQYAPSGTDTFFVSVSLFSGNTYQTPMGSGYFATTHTVTNWTEFSLDITYTGSGIPDTIQVIISSSSNNNSQAGSTAYVDDVSLVDCSSMTVSATPTAATCTQSNGSAVAIASGGAGPYTYSWSNSDTSYTISNLGAASYNVVATDTNGCTARDTAVVAANNLPFTVTVTPTASSCLSNNGSVTATASAGTSPYTYLWNNSDTAHVLSNLGPGSYQVTVTDAHGCSTSGSAAVTTASGPSVTDSVTSPLCHGQSTGAVTVTVSGGTAPITYLWSNNDTTKNLSSVPSATYSLTVTDASQCSFTISADVSQPAALTASSQVTNISCNGFASGSINLTVTGGAQPYGYAWYCCAGNNLGGGNPKAALAAGDYNVFISDSNGCTFEAFDTVTEPLALILQTFETDATAQTDSDGAASVSITGGTGHYTVSWSTQANGDTITKLLPGTYSVTVTDSLGCTSVDSAIVGVTSAINNITMPLARLYPNPANNQLTVEPGSGMGKYQFCIFSADGKMVSDETLTGKWNVDVTQLTPGLYTYRLSNLNTGGLQYGKVEVQH